MKPETTNCGRSGPMLIGVALGSMMAIQVAGKGSSTIIIASSLIALIVLYLTALSYKPETRISLSRVVFLAIFCSLVLTSAAQTALNGDVDTLVRAGALVSFILVGCMYAIRFEHRLLERAVPYLVYTFVFVLIYALIDGDRRFSRLSAHLHSNLWGYIVATIGALIAQLRTGAFVRLVIASFFIYMLAFEFQVRGALLWLFLALIASGGIKFTRQLQNNPRALISLAAASTVLLCIFFAFLALFETIAYEIFKIDSSTRGVSSGLSGRSDIWHLFLQLYTEHPLFGHGLDSSRSIAERFFGGSRDTGIASTHNSFLTILFELGLVGLLCYVILIFFSLYGVIRTRRYQFMSFMFVSLLIGLTESRPLNIGNPSGILLILLLPYYGLQSFGSSRQEFTQR